jgi:hypothetical protein
MLTPPTPKIRVTVPVSPEVLSRFQRLSKVAGQSVGKAMGEWLEETQEGLDPMIEILEKHKKAPLEAIRTLQNYAQTLDTVTGDLFQKVRQIDGGGPQLAAAAAAADDAVGALKRGLTPPSSNTGGKGSKTTKKASGGSK